MEPDKRSEQGKRLEEVISRLNQLYSEGVKDTIITLPGIFGKQRNETFITSWLAYLLNPDINGLGLAPLNALLQCYTQRAKKDPDSMILTDAEQVSVETEYTFTDSGRRIDLLITTESYVIGVEHKIDAGEHGDQTSDYWQGLLKLRDAENQNLSQKPSEPKGTVAIYLTPKANSGEPVCDHFVVVTYSDWLNKLKEIPYEYQGDHRKNFFFYEYLLYVEEELMDANNTGYPKMNETVELYHSNSIVLRKAKEEYEKYNENLGNWLVKRAKEIDSRFLADAPKPTKYWQLWEDRNWKELNFHFELNWQKTEKKLCELNENDNVLLYAHLETNDLAIREHFNLPKGNNLHCERVAVDFSSEEKAEQSLQTIVGRLRSQLYQQFAQLADDYLAKTHNKNPEP